MIDGPPPGEAPSRPSTETATDSTPGSAEPIVNRVPERLERRAPTAVGPGSAQTRTTCCLSKPRCSACSADAADEQPGADQQDGRGGDLADENQRARLGAPRQPRRHDIAPLQHGLQQHRGSTQRRDQPEQQAGRLDTAAVNETARRSSATCNSSAGAPSAIVATGAERTRPARMSVPHAASSRPAARPDAGEQQVLRQQLAHQPQAGGAERDADGQLSIARPCAPAAGWRRWRRSRAARGRRSRQNGQRLRERRAAASSRARPRRARDGPRA